jgi:hypothetical protein
VYVDDVLIIATAEEIKRLHELCVKEFRWVTLDTGKQHSYLGMQLDFFACGVRINMSSYTEKVLDFYGKGLEPRRVPGKKGVFLVSETSAAVSAAEKQRFHTVVAKLLYLAKRARPDIISVVSFSLHESEGADDRGCREIGVFAGIFAPNQVTDYGVKTQEAAMSGGLYRCKFRYAYGREVAFWSHCFSWQCRCIIHVQEAEVRQQERWKRS